MPTEIGQQHWPIKTLRKPTVFFLTQKKNFQQNREWPTLALAQRVRGLGIRVSSKSFLRLEKASTSAIHNFAAGVRPKKREDFLMMK